MDLSIRRFRAAQAAESPEYLTFWKDHGREWAEKEADDASLDRVAAMVEQTGGSRKERAAAIVAAMKAVWSSGFSNPQEAYGWEEMGDELPGSALVAFAEGAHAVWKERKPA